MSVQSTGNLIVDHQIKKGGVVMTASTLDSHLESLFGTKDGKGVSKSKIVEIKDQTSSPDPSVVFELTTVDSSYPKPRKNRYKKDSKAAGLNDKSPLPTVLVEYSLTLDGGKNLLLSEYSHLFKKDGEAILICYPITKKDRIKPDRGSELTIKHGEDSYLCYTLGIHTDIPEWGLSISIYLVKPNE